MAMTIDTPSFIGSLTELSEKVAHSLMFSGSSVMQPDVLNIIKTEVEYYKGYTDLEAHKDLTVQPVNDPLQLTDSEWSVIQPVVIAACKLLQAERVEASGSIGAERFGLDAGTAQQLYDTARQELPNNAFVSAPYSLNFDED